MSYFYTYLGYTSKPLYLAFDSDYQDNPVVARQLARLLKLRLDNNRQSQSFASTKILCGIELAKELMTLF